MKDKLGNNIHIGDMVAWACQTDYEEYELEVSEVDDLRTEGPPGKYREEVRVQWGVHKNWEAGYNWQVVVVKTP